MTDTVPTEEFPCERCTAVYKTARHLGVHRRSAHGIAGTSTTAVRNREKVKQKRRREPNTPRDDNRTVPQMLVDYLKTNRGQHYYGDIASDLGENQEIVLKALSQAKSRGYPIGSDGHGNWLYIPDGLKVVASDRPRTTVGKELVPVPTTNGHKPQRVFRPVELGDDLELLETESEDGGSSLWLATRIK